MIEGQDLELFERSLVHAVADNTGAALDRALEDLGWHEALSDDRRAAVSLLFELQGANNVTSSALDQVLATSLGSLESAVLLPEPGEIGPPASLERGRISLRGVGTSRLGSSQAALIVARAGTSCAVFEVDAPSLPRRPIGGIDPSLGLVEVRGEVSGGTALGHADWGAALALGQLALGHELVGASRRMLTLAREHSLERIQFGRPIARFQAIRHRLAETLVAIEAADALLTAAWLDIDQHSGRHSASMAKATAARSARVAARHCQQVLAGIGFTIEHPLHRYVTRVLVLEQLLGSTRTLTRQLGIDILERRQLPRVVPL